MPGISCGFILSGFAPLLGATWLCANPGCPLQGQLGCLSSAWMCSHVGERSTREHGKTHQGSWGLHSEMAQSYQRASKCKPKHTQGTFLRFSNWRDETHIERGSGLMKWNWVFSSWWRENQPVNFPVWGFGKWAVPLTWTKSFWGFMRSKQRCLQRWLYKFF